MSVWRCPQKTAAADKLGNNQMYHAGDPIGYADLSSSYWQQHLIGAGPVSYTHLDVYKRQSVYQLNELDFMYRQLSSDMQEEYVSLLTVFENLEALYICRNVIRFIPTAKA